MTDYRCAYAVNASTDADGPQCSSSGGFCFFCEMEPDPTTEGNDDLYNSLVELVNDLSEQHKEVSTICNVVHSMYKRTVQPYIAWTSCSSGLTVDKPEWTKDSIRRHLLRSNQFSFMFTAVVRNIFQSMIVRQNERMIDRESGGVVEETRRAFIETVAEYRKFEAWSASSTRPSKRRKQQA